jgi:hypothetical protein
VVLLVDEWAANAERGSGSEMSATDLPKRSGDAAVDHRLADPNRSPDERARLRRMVAWASNRELPPSVPEAVVDAGVWSGSASVKVRSS